MPGTTNCIHVIVIGDKREREDIDSDCSYDKPMSEKDGNIYSSLTKKQKSKC